MTDATGACSVTATANLVNGTYTVAVATANLAGQTFTLTNTTAPHIGPYLYYVGTATDTTTGVAANCVDANGGTSGSSVNCSLRDALAAAAAHATATLPAQVQFAQTTPTTITLANGTLNLPSYTTVQGATTGSGSALSNLITVDGNKASTVFTVAYQVTGAAIANLTITDGNANGPGYGSVGGGIYNNGSVTVSSSTFTGNTAAASGGAISNNAGTLQVVASTFVNNTAPAGFGGGIDNFANGTITVSNSTFTGNSSGQDGGAIYSNGTATILASTIVGNTSGYGGGVYNKGPMTIASSIVDGNSPSDCGGLYCTSGWKYVVFSEAATGVTDAATIGISFTDTVGNYFSQSSAYGQFSSAAGLASAFGAYFSENYSGLDTTIIGAQGFGAVLAITPYGTVNDIVISNPGKSFTATATDIPLLLSTGNNVSGIAAAQLNLSALGNYGGPTETMVPLSGSPALCTISPSAATGTDQRGQPRTVTYGATTCQDAGAVQTPY